MLNKVILKYTDTSWVFRLTTALILSSAIMVVPTIAYSNDLYINQVGDDLTLSITQDGEDNSIGTSSIPIDLDGDDLDVTLVQETDGATIKLSIDGNNNTLVAKQKCHNGSLCNADSMDLNIVGNNNNVKAGQGYKITENGSWLYDNVEHGGHDIVLDISGHYNTVKLSQRSQNSISDHNMDVDINWDSNNVHVMQEANGDKSLDLTVNNRYNDIKIHQKKSYGHSATITIDGTYNTQLDLQQGTNNTNSALSYTLNQYCTTPGGCAVTVLQE